MPESVGMQPPASLRRLIDAFVDDERMLDHESRAVRGRRKEVLAAMSTERGRFVDQLRVLEGANPRRTSPGRGSWIELARELGRTLRGKLGVSSAGDSITACRRSLRRTEEALDRALKVPSPKSTRALLLDQRARLDAGRDELIAIQY